MWNTYMNLRCATMDDAQLLLAWRNDAETRHQSGNSEEILWENHIAWLTQSLAMSTRQLYLAEYKGILVGTVRSDTNTDGSVELSWTVAPEQRGKGLGKAMVMQFVKQLHPGAKLIAIIRKGNISSEKIAQALGLHPENPKPSETQLAEQPLMIWR
jgi:RimJ/RimL family protein N-acetyltransferase